MLESPMIERIKAMSIPVTSPLLAANFIRDKITPKMGSNKLKFDEKIQLLTEKKVVTHDPKEAELMFSYIVYDAVQHHVSKQFKSIEDTIETASAKTKKLMETMGCNVVSSFNVEPAVTVIQEDGTSVVKQRVARGSGMSKKDRCLALYKEKIVEPAFKDNPKAMIDLFMTEFGLSKPGATTYEYNCRKGVWS